MTDSPERNPEGRGFLIRIAAYVVFSLEFVFIFIPSIRYPRNYGCYFVLGLKVADFQWYAFWSLVIAATVWRWWVPSIAKEWRIETETAWAVSLPILFFAFMALAPSVCPVYSN